MYCQTRLNCEYDKGCPSLSAITYSDLEAALASRRQFTRHLGMGISLLAAFVLSVVEITGLLCSDRHARRTEIYGVGASRNTQSHCKARASSRRSPAYKPIMVNRYGGSPLTVSSSTSTCWSVSESFFWVGFPPFAEIPSHGLYSSNWLRSAEEKMHFRSIIHVLLRPSE